MRLALPVELVEQHGDACRLHLVVGRQQPGAERGVADAAAGIDARPEHEAEVIGRRRLVEAGGVGQRPQAGCCGAGACTCRPLATKARLRPFSGTTSQTVAERHEIEQFEQRRLAPIAP